jgi:hypothetical protein
LDNLNDYVKQDILSQTLGNSFYANRRRIAVDHWLGGYDPTEKNETRWRETLAANPALLKRDIIPTTFGSAKECSEGCPTNALITGNDFLGNQQLWYVRDETTGFIRARTRINTR